MVFQKLNDINDDECEKIDAYEYLARLFNDSEKKEINQNDDNKNVAYLILSNLKKNSQMAVILEDLIFGQDEIDILSSSIYPSRYAEYINFLTDKKHNSQLSEEEYNKKQFSFVDPKRFILLLYKSFQQRVESEKEELQPDELETSKFDVPDTDRNFIRVDITDKTLRDAYTAGTSLNLKLEKSFRDYTELIFQSVDTSKFSVFTTGIENASSKFQSYTYKEIMNNKNKKSKYLNLSKETKDFIAKVLLPLDIEAITSSAECGYRALFNIDILSKYDIPTQQDIDNGRFNWLVKNETDQQYIVDKKSIIIEKTRELLDDPNFTSYLDDRKFYAIVLYRTLNFLKDEAPNKKYFPEDLINFTMKLKGAYDSLNIISKDPSSSIPVFYKFDDDNKMEVLELTHENLENYFYDELTNYVNVMINKDPRNFEEIITNSAYPFTRDELNCYLRLVDGGQERLLYQYYKSNGINEKELFDIINANEDLSIDNVLLYILKNDINKKGIENLSKIIKAGNFESKNIVGFLRGNYFLGNISIEEINKFRDEVFAKIPGIDTTQMQANSKQLIKQFLILNKEEIFDNLAKNEGFEEKDFEDLLNQFDFLKYEYTKNQLMQIKEDYQYNKSLYTSNNCNKNEKELFEIESMLDTLMYSPSILKLLYNENIIDKNKGIELGGADFINQIQNNQQITAKTENSEENNDKQNTSISFDNLKSLFKQSVKISKRDTKYSSSEFIDRFKKFESMLDEKGKKEFLNAFNSYQCELIKNNNKFYQDSLIEMGRNGLLSKESLYMLACKEQNYMNVIGALIADENTLDVTTLKYIFNDTFNPKADYNTKHQKRILLEKLFKTRYFSQDDRFLILMSVYGCHDNKCSELQRGYDSDNFQYFIDSQYLILDEINENTKKEFVKVPSKSKSKKENTSVKAEQIKYPFFDRHDTYYNIDNTITFTRTANAWIYVSKKYNRVAIETIGTKKHGSIKSDLTNHSSYTMDLNTYEQLKEKFIDIEDDKRTLNFSNVISYFRMNKDDPNLKRVNHIKTWKQKIKESFYTDEDYEKEKEEREKETVLK